MAFMDERIPETVEAFGKMREVIFKDGALDTKTKCLIAVSSALLMRCKHCADSHAKQALAEGATKDEVAEAISVAMFMAAGSQFGWANELDKSVYERTLDEI